MAHVLLALARRHPFDRADEVHEILPRNWVGSCVLGQGRLQLRRRIDFNPTLRRHPGEERSHALQSLKVGHGRAGPGFTKGPRLIDTELRDVNDAAVGAEFLEEVGKLAVPLDRTRRETARFPVVHELLDYVLNCWWLLGIGTRGGGRRNLKSARILPNLLQLFGFWPFHLAGSLADEAVDAKRASGVDRTGATAVSAIRPELAEGLSDSLFPPGFGALGGVAFTGRERCCKPLVQHYTPTTIPCILLKAKLVSRAGLEPGVHFDCTQLVDSNKPQKRQNRSFRRLEVHGRYTAKQHEPRLSWRWGVCKGLLYWPADLVPVCRWLAAPGQSTDAYRGTALTVVLRGASRRVNTSTLVGRPELRSSPGAILDRAAEWAWSGGHDDGWTSRRPRQVIGGKGRGRSAIQLREPAPKSEPTVEASRNPIDTANPECRGARIVLDLRRFGYKNGYRADHEIDFGHDPCSRGERQHTPLHPPFRVFRGPYGHKQRWFAFQREPSTHRGES